ncbi:MAG: ATP-binding protein [Exilibacterium sp.]
MRLSERGNVIVDIADNGRGIADDIATKIFVPFFTTKKNGSGIGLALTQQIMLAHGGSITHMRNTDGGATFSLMF